jgi:hypothetical protein
MVNGGKRYVDWLPIETTKSRANAFLSRGRPFNAIIDEHKAAMTRMYTIRNAIAHHSNYARRQFIDKVVQDKSLPPSQRRPGGYLQGQHRSGQSRFEFHIAETLRALRALV